MKRLLIALTIILGVVEAGTDLQDRRQWEKVDPRKVNPLTLDMMDIDPFKTSLKPENCSEWVFILFAVNLMFIHESFFEIVAVLQ
jgi:hypothetical protein